MGRAGFGVRNRLTVEVRVWGLELGLELGLVSWFSLELVVGVRVGVRVGGWC